MFYQQNVGTASERYPKCQMLGVLKVAQGHSRFEFSSKLEVIVDLSAFRGPQSRRVSISL